MTDLYVISESRGKCPPETDSLITANPVKQAIGSARGVEDINMKDLSEKLKAKIKKLPDSPGVYKFFDLNGCLIYVGKAGSLKKRVSSYFQKSRVRDNRLELLVNKVENIEIIKTASEAEALIYEAGLIKDHRPKFNIELKDDKSYPFLKLTVNEAFSRLFITRRKIKDGAIYYGPYVNVKLLKEAVSFMKKVFPLRTCRCFHKTVCLEYHLDQCLGPCEARVSQEAYKEIVEQLKQFLEGRKDDLLFSLTEKMKQFSCEQQYEKARALKERIQALTAVRQLYDRAQYPMFGELDELKNVLRLAANPVIIECFDVSNISGKQAVGSMVRFLKGEGQKSEYKKFRIKTVKCIDDYSMIREVVRRRYKRLIAEEKALPDLVLIDGGKGHLAVAKQELDKLGLKYLAVASIAKEYNHLYTVFRSHPVRLSPGSRVLLLIQRIRDEAHRFAVRYHRVLRRSDKFDSELKKISGVGPVKERKLIESFGNVSAISRLLQEDLIKAGIDKRTAKAIVEYFNKSR
ncbi:MAG: excinuclease ABC subunit UvrC [Candidatus Omnitrophota bacterium]